MNTRRICQRCESLRLMDVSAKCNDMCWINLDNQNYDGYVPDNFNLCNNGRSFGGGDYIDMCVCANCGHVQGQWPLITNIMNNINDESEEESDD